MRFKIIAILVLLVAVAMGMQDANANIQAQKNDPCSAAEAYKLGQEGKEKPENCAIGKASVVHVNWARGHHEHVTASGNVDLSAKKSEMTTN